MMRRPVWNYVVCSALIVGCSFAPTLLAGDTDGKEQADSAEKRSDEGSGQSASPAMQAVAGKSGDADVEVYTNQDLQRMFGAARPSNPPETAPPGSTPESSEPTEGTRAPQSALEQVLGEEKLRQERQAEIPAAEQAVGDARERVKEMERRVLASKNPLLARPALPEDEQTAGEWAESGAAGRVSIAEQELDAARTALAKAEQALRDLRRP
jgi:hypothetical protein